MAINNGGLNPVTGEYEETEEERRRREAIEAAMGGGSDSSDSSAGWTSTPAGAGAGTGYGASKPKAGTDYDSLFQELYGGIKNDQDPYLGQMDALTKKMLDPNYKAYSDQQIQGWYDRGKGQLEGDLFKSWDEDYGRTMANRNISGSGVGNLAMGKILNQKGGALEDLWGAGQERADAATRADVDKATSMLPVMSQLRNMSREQLMQLLGYAQADKSGQQAQKSANASGIGQAAASIIPMLLKLIFKI